MVRISTRQLLLLGVLFVVVFLVAFAPKLQTREMEEVLGESEVPPQLLEPSEEDVQQEEERELVSYGWQSAPAAEAWSSGDGHGLASLSGAALYYTSLGMAHSHSEDDNAGEGEGSILDNYWGLAYSSEASPLEAEAVILSEDGFGGTVPLEWMLSSILDEEGMLEEETELFGGGTLHFGEYTSEGLRSLSSGTESDIGGGGTVDLEWLEGSLEEEWEIGPTGSLYSTLLAMLEYMLPVERHSSAHDNAPNPEPTMSPAPGPHAAPASDAGVGGDWDGGMGYYEHLLDVLQASMERLAGDLAGSSDHQGGPLIEVYAEVLDELAEVVEGHHSA